MNDEHRAELLVVDDDRLMRTFVSDALSVRGFDVTAATDGKEAITHLTARDVDVVVCDMVMPEIDGLGVLEWVQTNSPSTEVVMLTGHADMETALTCLRRGAFDLVRKEKEMPELVPTVERAVERRHLREARSLQNASHLIFTTEERQDLPERIVAVATEVMAANDASLMLPDVNGQLYVAYSNILSSQVQKSTRVNVGERIAGRVAKDREPLLLHGPLDTDLRFPEIDKGHREIYSSIVYPLFSGDELLGVLNLNRVGAGHRPFRHHDIEQATLLASQIVLALENQRLIRRVTATDKFTAVGQLSTAIAHEINNPITFVLSSVEFVLEQLRPLLDRDGITPEDCFRALGGPSGTAEMCEALADAREGATRIRDVVRDLRNMVRANPSDRQPFDLNGSIHAALRIAAAELRPVARTHLELGPDLVVVGCRGTMSQVFVNLFMNAAYALKGAPTGVGEVTVRSRREGSTAIVEVGDNGPGIPPDQLARIFEPFFTTKPVGVGTGLGLPMCREIIEWHSGDMRVRSSLDDGTVFTLTLPAIGIDGFSDARPTLPRTSTAPAKKHRLLVIDDEEAIGRGFVRLLPEYEVVTTTSANEALELLAADSDFTVILCDVVMPELSGIQLHAELEKIHPELARRVVFITGSVGYADVREFAEAKDTPVLEKPVNMDAVRALLDQRG